MGFSDRIKLVGAAIFNFQGVRERLTSEATLRQMYDPQAAHCLLPNEVYLLCDAEGGHLRGFQYVCGCGVDFKIIPQLLFLEEFACHVCKNRFRISDKVGITHNGVVKDEFRNVNTWSAQFAKLKPRPMLSNSRGPQIVDTWGGHDDFTKCQYDWDGDKTAEARADINNGLW